MPWFFGLLTLIFITLKLCAVITWSWFWVLSPAIFVVGIWIFFMVFAVLIAIIAASK